MIGQEPRSEAITIYRGQLDCVTNSGRFEGWAYKVAFPLSPLEVYVAAGRQRIAQGLANLYRWDLADTGIGAGWCAFNLRVFDAFAEQTGSNFAANLIERGLSLHDASTDHEIPREGSIRESDAPDFAVTHLEGLNVYDPTTIRDIDELKSCGSLFDRFIEKEGVEKFVRHAYLYVLSREADASGMCTYVDLLRSATLSPFGVLKALHDSGEVPGERGIFVAPTEPGFAFRS